jgi:cytochrome c
MTLTRHRIELIYHCMRKLRISVSLYSPGAVLKRSALAAVFAVVSVSSHANLELAQKNACTACHAVEKKLVGPAYQDVAKKYAGQKDAAAGLAASIQKGGSGKWGPIPMPAQPNLSEADAKTLANWILAGGK